MLLQANSLNMPSPLSKHRDSPLGRQLRSPRGSPRSSPRGLVHQRHCLRLSSRHFHFLFLMSCFLLLFLFQSTITLTSSDNSPIHKQEFSTLGSLQASRHRATERAPYPPTSLSESSFSYTNYPILPSNVYTPHSSHPLPVLLLGSEQTRDAENSLLLDGLERSRYLRVVHDKKEWLSVQTEIPNQTVVHMVDWDAVDRDCHILEGMYENVVQPAPHILVYFDSSASPRVTSCPTVNALFHNQYRIIKQSIVLGRHWDSTKQWVSKGKILQNSYHGIGPLLHSPHFLRERFVDMLKEAVRAWGEDFVRIVTRSRPLDVSHVWRKGDSSHYGRLRRQVSLAIQELNGTRLKKHSLRWLVRPRGNDAEIGKALVQPEYVVTLLQSKIIVVAQRDEWEGHFRLLESMASGALVLTDEMLANLHGLRNGTNILTYQDMPSLQRLILHYAHPDHEDERIAIAQRGFALALGKHRSWHRMEQLLFGAARSRVDKPLEPAPSRRKRN